MKKILLFLFTGFSFQLMAIDPERDYARTPDAFGLAYSEYKVKTPDNYSINVWELKFEGEHLHGFNTLTRKLLGDEYLKSILEFLEINKI